MSSIVYLKNKKNGVTYAYLNESVWDSTKKKCVCKRKCLGHLDPDTGEILPNRGHERGNVASVKSVGLIRFLDSVSESIGIVDALKVAFPDNWKLVLSTVYLILYDKNKLSDMEYWSEDHTTPYGKPITANAVSDLMRDISQNNLFSFYRMWRDRFADESYYMIHTSSKSTFDTKSYGIQYDAIFNLEFNTQTNITTVFGSSSRIPITFTNYSREPKTLTDLRKRLNDVLWMDFPDCMHVLDSDYCVGDNFYVLLKSNIKFVLRAPPDFPQAGEAILRVKDRIMDIDNAIVIGDYEMFAMSFINYYNGKKCFTHIIFDAQRAEHEFSLFLSMIDQCYNELLSDIYVPEHKVFYDKYFIIKETSYGRMVEQNGDAIMTFNNIAGFMVLFTNTVRDSVTACRYIFQKDRVQEYFEDIRNRKDREKLKLYYDQIYEGRLFIQFLATAVYEKIRQKINSVNLLKDISYSDIIHEMDSIKKMSVPGFSTPFYTSLNNRQERILRAFSIDISEFRK